jgi:hypothetical protein
MPVPLLIYREPENETSRSTDRLATSSSSGCPTTSTNANRRAANDVAGGDGDDSRGIRFCGRAHRGVHCGGQAGYTDGGANRCSYSA